MEKLHKSDYFPLSWAPPVWEVYKSKLYRPDDPSRPCRPKAGQGLVMMNDDDDDDEDGDEDNHHHHSSNLCSENNSVIYHPLSSLQWPLQLVMTINIIQYHHQYYHPYWSSISLYSLWSSSACAPPSIWKEACYSVVELHGVSQDCSCLYQVLLFDM